jgi:hypothetical protein
VFFHEACRASWRSSSRYASSSPRTSGS